VCAAIFIYVIVNGTIQEVPVTGMYCSLLCDFPSPNGCLTKHEGRKRFALLTPEQEHMMGEMMAKQMIDKVEGDILPLSHPVSIAVKMIGDRICEANGLDKMTYFVIESDTANAFVVGGKYVFVYLGIVPVFKDADGAALVIAHEISHVLAGHASDGALRVAFTVACSVFLGVFGDMLLSAIGRTFLKLAFVLPRSRAAEYEADQIGTQLP
jgi:predicted Zn-dependent protease